MGVCWEVSGNEEVWWTCGGRTIAVLVGGGMEQRWLVGWWREAESVGDVKVWRCGVGGAERGSGGALAVIVSF